MKRMITMLLIVTVICCMLTVSSLAAGNDPVISPEQGNTEVDPNPTSPQTGGLPVGAVIAVAGVLGAVAVVAGKKAIA